MRVILTDQSHVAVVSAGTMLTQSAANKRIKATTSVRQKVCQAVSLETRGCLPLSAMSLIVSGMKSEELVIEM